MSREILRKALITEKAVAAKELANLYTFEVAPQATKPAIKQAVESLFKVKVKDIHTLIVHGKFRRVGRHRGQLPNWKKAIVTLAPGQKIGLFESK